MKWFKHLSGNADEEEMAALLDELGPEGYGVFFLMIEKISDKLDKNNNTSITFPQRKWAQVCCVSTRKVQKFFKTFSKLFSSIKIQFNNDYSKTIEVDYPKLLEMRDEYTLRKVENIPTLSGQKPDTIGTVEVDKEVDKDLKALNTSCFPDSSKNPDDSDDPVILEFPSIRKDEKPFLLRKSRCLKYANTYAGVPKQFLFEEFQKAHTWITDNQTHRKTVRGYPGFLTRWINKAVDQGRINGFKNLTQNSDPTPADDHRKKIIAYAKKRPKYQDDKSYLDYLNRFLTDQEITEVLQELRKT